MADSSKKPVGFGRETARKIYRMSQQHSMGSMLSKTNPPVPMSFSFWQATLREYLGNAPNGGIMSGRQEELPGTAEADLWIIDPDSINDAETVAYKLQGEPYIRVTSRDDSVWGRPGDYVCGIIHGGEFLALSGAGGEMQLLEMVDDLPDMSRDDSSCYMSKAYVIQASVEDGSVHFERGPQVWVSSFGFTNFAFGARESGQIDDSHGDIRGDFILGKLENHFDESPDPYVEPDIYRAVAGGRTHARFELQDDLHADKTNGSGTNGEVMAYRVRDFPDATPNAAAPFTWSLRPSRVNETAEYIVFAEQSFTGYCFGDDGAGETQTRGEIIIAEWVPRQNDTLIDASDFPSTGCGVLDSFDDLAVFGGGHWRVVGGGHSVLVGYSESNYNQGDTGDVTVEFFDTTAIDPIGRAIEVHEFLTPIKASDAENTYEVTIVWDAAKKRWYGFQFRGPGCGLQINTEAGDDFGRVEIDPSVFGEGLEWDEEYCTATLDIDCDTLNEIFPPGDEIELDEYCVLTIKEVPCSKIPEIPCCADICDRLDSIEDRLDTIEEIIEYLIECCEENRTCCRYNTYCCEYLDARVDYCCGDGKPGPGDEGGGPLCGRCVWEWNDAGEEPTLVESCSGGLGCNCDPPTTFDVPGIYFTDCRSLIEDCCQEITGDLVADFATAAACCLDGISVSLVKAGTTWVGTDNTCDPPVTIEVSCDETWGLLVSMSGPVVINLAEATVESFSCVPLEFVLSGPLICQSEEEPECADCIGQTVTITITEAP